MNQIAQLYKSRCEMLQEKIEDLKDKLHLKEETAREMQQNWNWREHTKEENIAHGKEVTAQRNAEIDQWRRDNPDLYAKMLKQKYEAEDHAKKQFEQDKAASAGDKRISPVYWVTNADFERATGHKYDPMSAEDRRLFFDLNASGKSTVSPTAGVGQGPAYDSPEYHTMRTRPDNIPQFGTPQARYDRLPDGTIANTTQQSRDRAQKEADDAAASKWNKAKEALKDQEIQAKANKIVGGELAMDYINSWKDRIDTEAKAKNLEDQRRDNYINDISRDVSGNPSRGTDDARLQDVHMNAPVSVPTTVSNMQNSLIGAAAKTLSDKGKQVLDFAKKSLMQTQPMQGTPAGSTDIDVQHGQYPIYPEGQNDSSYQNIPQGSYSPKPYWAPKTASATNIKYDDTNMNPEVERQKRRGGNDVSDTQNALVSASAEKLSNAGKNAMNFMKTSLMQTQTMQGRYPEAGANFGEQQKTPTRAPSNTTYTTAPYDPNVVHEIDIQNRGPINLSHVKNLSAIDLLNLNKFKKQGKYSPKPK